MPEQGQSARHGFCPGCGAEAGGGASLCETCGHSLSQSLPKVDESDPRHTEANGPAASPSPPSTQRLLPSRLRDWVDDVEVTPVSHTGLSGSNVPTGVIGKGHERSWRKGIGLATAVLIIVVVVGIGLTVLTAGSSASVDKNSISYRDGYQSGYSQTAGSDPFLNLNGSQYNISDACKYNVMPLLFSNGDDRNGWLAGCVDGLNEAVFEAQHPGATGN